MLRGIRLRRAHNKFLESCRNLAEGRNYWSGMGPIRRWFVATVVPMPLLGLHGDGAGLYEALQWLEANCRAVPLDEECIRGYHRMIYASGPEPAGTYRKGKISVVGSKVPRAAPEKVPVLMKQLDLKLRAEYGRLEQARPFPKEDVLRVAVDVYQRIGLIHPFPEANGRVARLAMNHLLRQYNLGYVVLPPLGEPGPLWEALQEAHHGRLDKLIEVARECIVRV
jgi:fido (protein-threonine AMPylation protein)